MSSPSMDNPFRVARMNGVHDYDPDWDVPSVNDRVTETLVATILSLRGRERPDPALMIPVLLAPPGYGKTHLFGRIAHRVGQETLFVFVPQLEDIHRPLDHVRWHAVESLFTAPPGGRPVISQVLARLCQASFVTYLDQQLPPSLAAKHRALCGRLRTEPAAALDIIARITELAPFERLADSAAAAFPTLRADVVRAFVLGWSPASLTVRRWLRGESLPEDDLHRLRLAEEPPGAAHVLLTIASLLKFQMPVVICCDQLESVLQHQDEGARCFTNALMGLLHSVPNQVVIISCLKDRWQDFLDNTEGAFKGRVCTFELEPLAPAQAAEVARRRMRTSSAGEIANGDFRPFRQSAVTAFATTNQVGPRGLIKVCAEALDFWADQGAVGWIEHLPCGMQEEDLPHLFLREWDKELEAINADPDRSPDNLAEDRLFRAVREVFELAQGGELQTDGVQLTGIDMAELKWGSTRRPALKVKLRGGAETVTVLVAVTKLDNGTQFRGFYNALFRLFADPVVGVLLIHPAAELRVGAATQKEFDRAREFGHLRTFSLAEHSETAPRLECLLTILDKARAKELLLGRTPVSDKDCLDLAVKTSVMTNLDLLESLCSAWAREPAVPPTASPVPGPGKGGGRSSQGGVAVIERPPRLTGGGPRALDPVTPSPTLEAVRAQGEAIDVPVWVDRHARLLCDKLRLWGLPVEANGVEVGPKFARLRVRPLGKTSVNRIRNKAEDLKIHLALDVKPLIGAQAGYISVDVRLPQGEKVRLKDSLAHPPAGTDGDLLFPVGRDVSGRDHWLNLANPADCHVLVAGTTGSGKSEFLKAMVAGLAERMSPDQVQFVLIDPKQVTFNFSGESPYVMRPIARTVDEAVPLIAECFANTEERYGLLKKRHLENVCQLNGADALPRIVVIIDEFADLMVDKESRQALEKPLKRIGALARAAGIHLVLATQRPEASVVTPLLRSNLPGRISLKVASEADSKLILGVPDAANLLGGGDLLWKHGGGLLRLQSPFVERDELESALRLS